MKKQLHPCPSTQYCSVWNRGVTILESFISFMYQTESLMCSKRYDCWSLWVPLLCMCARTLHGYDFLGQLSHLNRYTQTVSRSSIFFIILIWFDICHIVHYIYIYMYVCMYMLTHPPGPTCFFYFIDWISLQGQSSHILYIYTYYIYTYYIYIYTRPKFGDILWPFLRRTIFWQGGCTPSMTRLGGSWAPGGPCGGNHRLKMGDWPVKHVDFQLQNIGLQWNVHDDDKNIGGFMPKSGICFVFWSWHIVI